MSVNCIIKPSDKIMKIILGTVNILCLPYNYTSTIYKEKTSSPYLITSLRTQLFSLLDIQF